MNEAYWHLMVNHLPIAFPMVGLIVILTGFVAKSKAVKQTALMIFIFGAMSTMIAMKSGEGAEKVVEKVSGVTKDYIENHEEVAEIFALFSYILGGFSLFGLWASFKQKSFFNIIAIGAIVMALVVLFFAKKTGTTGGEIRHTEIRSESSIPAPDDSHSDQEDDH